MPGMQGLRIMRHSTHQSVKYRIICVNIRSLRQYTQFASMYVFWSKYVLSQFHFYFYSDTILQNYSRTPIY